VKPLLLRQLAVRDIEEAVAHYQDEAPERVTLAFVDALEHAFGHVSRNPASGSPRYAHELRLPGLRAWPIKGFPFLVFYVEQDQHLDVWRVLHAQRDIPAWMSNDD